MDAAAVGVPIRYRPEWFRRNPDGTFHSPGAWGTTWEDLVDHYAVTGFRAHDARYVAMMQLCGIQRFLTYNVKHFEQFPIAILDPRTLA